MSLANIPDKNLLTEQQVLHRIDKALSEKKPLSLIRIGDGENIVLSQYQFLNEKEFMNTYWAKQSREGMSKGVTLPNVSLRNQMIRALRKADIVGVCKSHNDEMLAPEEFKRKLTNKIFDHHRIKPADLCYVFVNRKMVSHRHFWELLHRYRVLLISKWSWIFKDYVNKNYASLRPRIVGCIDFNDFKEIPAVLKKAGQYPFDIALISAGVNAVVLAPAIAELYGKVALDFGKTMMFFLKGDKRLKPWKPNASQPFRQQSGKPRPRALYSTNNRDSWSFQPKDTPINRSRSTFP